MNVEINGESRELPGSVTVGALLAQLGIEKPEGIAVAVNARVVTRGAYETHALADGDAVEIIRAVAGG